ncbi:MAG: FMN-binding protein, partial [Eubacteriales bacterium]
TVNGGYIVSVDMQSTGDDREFFNRAIYPVVLNIIRSQSTAVDVVSGATFSSFAIIDAVENALSGTPVNAQADDTAALPDVYAIERDTSMVTPDPVLTPSPSPTPSPTPTPSSSPTPEPDGPFAVADGAYTGSGRGHKGTIEVEVTIENGFITAIKIISYRDTERYFTRAKSKMIDRIISVQSTGVDTVSGATQSSEGILGAVEDALYGG